MKKSLKIGFVALSFSNFQAAEYRIFERSLVSMKQYAETLDFTLVSAADAVTDEAGAIRAAADLQEQGIDFLLLQASSLILGDIVLPFAAACERIGFWVVPEPTFAGELPLNSLTGFNLGVSILRKQFPERPVKWFYGSPDGSQDFRERLSVTVAALRSLVNLKGSRIGLLHDVVPTFINLTYQTDSIREMLGVEVVPLTLEELFRRIRLEREADPEIVQELYRSAREVRVTGEEVGSMAKITRQITVMAEEDALDAVALRCWPEFQDELQLAPCASVAYLNDHGVITSCEGDLPGALSMLTGWYVSSQAPTMNDPVALDMENDLIQMWHCGPGPASWADEAGQILDYHHTLNRRIAAGEPRQGVSSDITFRRGDVTILHISGDAKSIFILEGRVMEGPAPPYPGSGGWIGELQSNGRHCSCADFLEGVAKYGFEHHYPIIRGHHEAALRELAGWCGMRVLDMPVAAVYQQRVCESVCD